MQMPHRFLIEDTPHCQTDSRIFQKSGLSEWVLLMRWVGALLRKNCLIHTMCLPWEFRPVPCGERQDQKRRVGLIEQPPLSWVSVEPENAGERPLSSLSYLLFQLSAPAPPVVLFLPPLICTEDGDTEHKFRRHGQ